MDKFKVVAVSNFGNETIDDELVAENFTDKDLAIDLCYRLNAKAGDSSRYFYEVFPQEKELYEFKP